MTVPARLRWRCRRGTKELDAVLLRFVERQYDALPAGERADFDRLLECEDDRLIDWILLGKESTPDDRFAALVRRIRGAIGF